MPATFLNDCVIDLQINISEENYLFSLNIDIYIHTVGKENKYCF